MTIRQGFLVPAGPIRASSLANQRRSSPEGLENCRNHLAAARKDGSYGESRLAYTWRISFW
jgi:hypothetical protein